MRPKPVRPATRRSRAKPSTAATPAAARRGSDREPRGVSPACRSGAPVSPIRGLRSRVESPSHRVSPENQSMPVMQEPNPRPSELDYVPPSSRPYKVSPGDSWWTLAERPDVTFSGMSAIDLCYFNFRTRKPSEINWYLHHKVGCRTRTRDGLNYRFAAADQPRIIYLPQAGHPPPIGEIRRKQTGRLNSWFGVVGKGGTQFVVVGIETVAGIAVSLDDPTDWMAITASINRLGPGFGASGGFAGVYVAGVTTPSQLNGHQEGDWDFNLALGPNWGKVAKAAVKSDRLAPLIQALAKIGAKTPAAFKRALQASPDKYGELVDSCRSFNDSLGMGEVSEPKVLIFDLPFGRGGVEASGYFGVSNFNAIWDNT